MQNVEGREGGGRGAYVISRRWDLSSRLTKSEIYMTRGEVEKIWIL